MASPPPAPSRIKGIVEGDARYSDVIRAVLVAHLHGNAPQVSVETGRKMVPNEFMPSFQALEESLGEAADSDMPVIKQFFFEKKNQKTFVYLVRDSGLINVFCFFFSKKNCLPSPATAH